MAPEPKFPSHISLGVVPGSGDRIIGIPRIVLLDGVTHFRPEVVLDLVPENVAEDAADQEDDEHEEQKDEVGQQHALDLLPGAEASQEADDDDDASGDDEDVGRGDEELVAEEALDEGLVGQGPDPDRDDDQASDLQVPKFVMT